MYGVSLMRHSTLQHEVAVLAYGSRGSCPRRGLALGVVVDDAVHDLPVAVVAGGHLPAGEVLAVEERGEAGRGIRGRRRGRGRSRPGQEAGRRRDERGRIEDLLSGGAYSGAHSGRNGRAPRSDARPDGVARRASASRGSTGTRRGCSRARRPRRARRASPSSPASALVLGCGRGAEREALDLRVVGLGGREADADHHDRRDDRDQHAEVLEVDVVDDPEERARAA